MDPELQDVEAWWAMRKVAYSLLLPRVLALGIAYLILSRGDKEYYDAQIAFFNVLTHSYFGYIYMSAVVFSFLTSWLNMIPLVQKARVTRDSLLANMYVLKVSAPEKSR